MKPGAPAVFLASAAEQNERMAAIAAAEGDRATAKMLRTEAAKLRADAQDTQPVVR